MPTFRLSDLDLDFISLVPAGDDPLARVVIAKADTSTSVQKLKSSAYPDLERKKGNKDNWVEAAGGLPSYIERIAKHLHYEQGMSIGHAIATAVNQCRKWAAGGKGANPDTVAKATKAIAEWEAKKARSKLKKDDFRHSALIGKNMSGESDRSATTLSNNHSNESSQEAFVANPKTDPPKSISKDDLPDEVVAYIEALENEVDDLTDQVTKADAPAPESEEDEDASTDDTDDTNTDEEEEDNTVTKGDPLTVALAKADPALRDFIQKQQSEITEATNIAKAERNARLEREYLAKAETMPMISEDRAELAGLLRSMADKLTPEEMSKTEKLLKAANEQIAKGDLFSEFGRGGGESTISKSIETRASELRKANSNLSHEQALALVYETDPSLYDQALKEA